MERQPPVAGPDAGMTVLMQAGYLPDTAGYSTAIRHYPGINAHPPWGDHGSFYFEVEIYVEGALIATARTETCDERGMLEMDLGGVAEKACGHSVQGMYVVKYHHAKSIPIEVYAFHIHKATGTYVSCNISPFIGDLLYPTAHTDQMENTLFWPGMVSGTDNEVHVLAVNPYDTAMGLQVHLIGRGGIIARTGMIHIRPHRAGVFSVQELFPGGEEDIRAAKGNVSLCVSAQYKLVAYVMFRSRNLGVMSMMDHLHTFCLA
jgi:hypothetical protein